jgi:hypothetical protein
MHLINYKRLLTILITASMLFSNDNLAFDAGEHSIIGDVAYKKYEPQFANQIKNLEADIEYSYGELVAMSGDMYISVEEISLDDPGIFNGFFHSNRKSLKKCIKKEIEAIRTQTNYAGCDDLDFAKEKLHYVTLAHDNYKHFAWHNVKKYIELHEKALWFAQLAFLKCTEAEKIELNATCEKKQMELESLVSESGYRKKQKSKYRRLPKLFPRKRFTQRYLVKMPKEKMIRLSLFTNAFADHYLTDAFSAGHLRIPRSQIDKFVEVYDKQNQSKKRNKGSSVSGALTQYLHNLDGSLTGIKVVNSLGENFIVRSDKQLFSKLNSRELSGVVEQNSQLINPIRATQASLNEVFAVINNGEQAIPKTNFSALDFVPYIENPERQSLSLRVTEHIKQHGSIKKAIKSMSSEMQLVYKSSMAIDDISYKEYFKNFVNSIPQMMGELRAQIEFETKDKELRKRIPKSLLSALKELN